MPLLGDLDCLILLILSAYDIFASVSAVPVEVVFDVPQETIEGGVRLTRVESQWGGYGEARRCACNRRIVVDSMWGVVYLYEHNGQTWTETAKLTLGDNVESTPSRLPPLVCEWFRPSLFGALTGNTLAVGGDAGGWQDWGC